MSVNISKKSRVCPTSPLSSSLEKGGYLVGISANVATFLNAKLLELGLTQTRFSELMAVSQATVSSWTAGEKWPRDYHFDRMQELFGWSFEEMVRGKNSPDDPVVSFMRDQLVVRGYQVFKKSPTKR